MAITWGTIKSLLLFFGPILLPKAISYYRSVRAAPSIHGIPIRPIPSAVSRALIILFITALVFVLTTLPPFSPENIYTLTQSRLAIPTDVLFTRITALRPNNKLTPTDLFLKSKFNSIDIRLLYLQFGPSVITDCQFCSAEDPNSFLYYSIPSLLAPHILNLVVLALVTSGLLIGKEGAIWRLTAVLSALVIALFEIYFVSTYRFADNKTAQKLEELDFFYWKARMYRNLALASLDGLLGWLLYLSSTNRAFLTPPTTAERVEAALKLFDSARNKIATVGVIKNTVNRDEELREKEKGYWVQEGRVMHELMQETEVIKGVNDALENRIKMGDVVRDAEMFAESVLAPLEGLGMNGNA